MIFLQEQLQEQKKLYEKIKKECEKTLKRAPKGKLIVSSDGSHPRFYLKDDSCKRNYISKKNSKLITELAQKEYCQNLLKVINLRLRLFDKLNKDYQDDELIQVYTQLNTHKKQLVKPFLSPFPEYAEEWQNAEFAKRRFYENDPVILTERGERVLSKSEKIIADKLFVLGIPYRYEYPIHISPYFTFHPDFTLLHPKSRKVWIWEHLGMMDNPDYVEKALKKIEEYAKHGYFPGVNLILTYETSQRPLNMQIILAMLKEYDFL